MDFGKFGKRCFKLPHKEKRTPIDIFYGFLNRYLHIGCTNSRRHRRIISLPVGHERTAACLFKREQRFLRFGICAALAFLLSLYAPFGFRRIGCNLLHYRRHHCGVARISHNMVVARRNLHRRMHRRSRSSAYKNRNRQTSLIHQTRHVAHLFKRWG